MKRFGFLGGAASLACAAAVQLGFFLLTARGLGPEQFGQLSMLFAFASPTGELIGLGAPDIMTMRVSRFRKSFPIYFRGALLTTLASLPIAFAVALFCRFAVMPDVSFWPIGLIIVAEALTARTVSIVEQAMIAHGSSFYAGLQRLFTACVRLGIALWFFFLTSHSLQVFAIGFATVSIANATLAVIVASAMYGAPKARGRSRLLIGPSFVVENLARSMAQSLDRISLSFVLSYDHLGIYSAGARVLQFAVIPVNAVLRDTYPGFFQAGRKNIEGTTRYAYRVLPLVTGVATVATIGAIVAAYLLPAALGSHYANSLLVGTIIAPSAIFIAVQYVFGDILTGAGRQTIRTRTVVVGLALAFPIILISSKLFGLYGAAGGFLLVQAVSAGLMIITVARERRVLSSQCRAVERVGG